MSIVASGFVSHVICLFFVPQSRRFTHGLLAWESRRLRYRSADGGYGRHGSGGKSDRSHLDNLRDAAKMHNSSLSLSLQLQGLTDVRTCASACACVCLSVSPAGQEDV